MFDSVEEGLEAMTGILAGIILQAVLGVIPGLPNIPAYMRARAALQLIPIINLVGSIVIVAAFDSWGLWYLIGWLFGTGIMAIAGLIESWLLTLYLVVGAIALVLKILKKPSI
jgi:hypothetical protein